MQDITSGQILLIEDEHDIADMLKLFFGLQGYTLHHASDAAEGLKLAARLLPHAVLLDLTLPDASGYHVTTQLRSLKRTAHLPILVTSKWGHRDRRLMALNLGADDYLTKPFDLQELLLRTQNCIAHGVRLFLTDLRTALPAAFTARTWIEAARHDPQRALVEVALDHTTPYHRLYGSEASAAVYHHIAWLLKETTHTYGHPDDFLGYLDEDHYLIVTRRDRAYPIAEILADSFNGQAARFYSPPHQDAGCLLDGAARHPFMRMTCRITPGGQALDLPASDTVSASHDS